MTTKTAATKAIAKKTSRPAPSPPYVMPYDPIAFVGWAGKGRKEVEIWIASTSFSDSLKERDVRAFDRRKNRWVGGITGRVRVIKRALGAVEALKGTGAPKIYFEEARLCSKDFDTLSARHGVSSEKVMQVVGSFLLDDYHGQGIGTALYLALASLARKLNVGVAADACFASSTSIQARRVWVSREFRSYVDVGKSDLVGVWVGSSRSAAG